MDNRNWKEDFHLENGNYTCICTICDEQFLGYKRRIYCKLCHDGLETQMERRYRNKILEKIDDLRAKILYNEKLPEGEQDESLLSHVSEQLDEALNSWYY